jgi:hypothetical protein
VVVQLRIQTPNDVSAETRAAIERKIRLALGRHTAGIDRAQVRLAPSREGRSASRCRIRVRLRDGEVFEVEDRAEDPRSAAGAAAWRLEHRMQRRRTAATDAALASRRIGHR